MLGFTRSSGTSGMKSQLEILRQLQRATGGEEESALSYYTLVASSTLRRFYHSLSITNIRYRYKLFRRWKANKMFIEPLFAQLEAGEREGRLNNVGLIAVADAHRIMTWRWIGHGPAPCIDQCILEWHVHTQGRFLIPREPPWTGSPNRYVYDLIGKYVFDVNAFFLPEEVKTITLGSDPTTGAELPSAHQRWWIRDLASLMYSPTSLLESLPQ